ncbi:thioredoxin-like protein [Ochromonadaceae sp. CCMP2298]|nr:thioredoxin-like protein [Ochromonadaceae sp. CCMP2298]
MLRFVLALIVLVCAASFEVGNRLSWIGRTGRPLLAVTEISSVDALDAATASGVVVVDYSTTWCGPCKIVAPKFVALSEMYVDVTFLKCVGDSSDEAKAVMKREGVRSVPAFHVWKDGKRVESITGARMDEVEAAIKAAAVL